MRSLLSALCALGAGSLFVTLPACSSSSSNDGNGNPPADSGVAADTGTAPVDSGTAPIDSGNVDDTGVADSGAADTGPQDTGPVDSGPPPSPANALYTMTNAATNEILGFTRADDGTLTPMAAAYPTGGSGSGAGLGEQGSLAYDRAKNRLFAVNAGSGSFSVFSIQLDGSLGTAVVVPATDASMIGPKSIAVHDDVVYVLYEGDATHPSKIAGWTVTGTTAAPIAGSVKNLSSDVASVDPAEIQFTPDGQFVVVTEKAAGTLSAANPGRIDTFKITSGAPGAMVSSLAGTLTEAQRPYGFDFANGYLMISVPSNSTSATYKLDAASGMVSLVAAGATEGAPCWVVASQGHTYTANAMGLSVSGYDVASDGSVAAISGAEASNAIVGRTGQTGAGPTTEVVSADGKYLYVLNAKTPSIGVFKIDAASGGLTKVVADDYRPTAPSGIVGLAVR